MAYNNITINIENLSDTEREMLMKLIDKANTPKMWIPQKNELYWYLSITGDIVSKEHNQSLSDDWNITTGNYYQTRREAKFALERIKVIHEMKMLSNGFKPLKPREQGYVLVYNRHLNQVEIIDICIDTYVYNDIHFETKKIAQQAIDTIGQERLKKYFFCIK